MTPEDRRTQAAQSIARATAAVERARAAAEQAEQIANDSSHLDKTLISLAYTADTKAGEAHDRRALARTCPHHANDPDATPAQADKDVNSASYHARQAETAADRAEKAAAAAKRAARQAYADAVNAAIDRLAERIGQE
jgi:hypothetical protein